MRGGFQKGALYLGPLLVSEKHCIASVGVVLARLKKFEMKKMFSKSLRTVQVNKF